MLKHKVALIGCGKRGKLNAGAIKTDIRCEMAAMVDIRKEAAEDLKKEYDFSSAVIYSDYYEMLQKENPEVVVICLWTPMHFEAIKACAESGVKVIFSEKPMAATWGEAVETARIVERTGCQLSYSHQRRFAEGNQLVRKLVSEGLIGDILRMDLFVVKNLLDCGTHTLDQALSFINEEPVKWVLGALDATQTLNWFDVPSESMFTGTLVFENGIIANIYSGLPDMPEINGVRIFGTKGYLHINWEGIIVRHAIFNQSDWVAPMVVEGTMETNLCKAFPHIIDCYEQGIESELSYKRALRATEVIFAFYESVRKNARVMIPLQGIEDNPFVSMYESGKFKV